jgi:hypothetical protein
MADHDQRFKLLLREFFAEFVQLFFPQWAGRFDFGGVEWLEQEAFLDPPQGLRQVMDLVARLPARQAPAAGAKAEGDRWLVLVQVEVESRDSAEPLRGWLFACYQHLRQRYRLPVLPIGLYLRVGLEGVGWDSYEEWFWEQRLVRFEYPYVGLPALDAFPYLQGTNLLGVALSALMRVPAGRRAELKAEAMQRLATAPENEARRYLLCECVEAYLPLEGPQLAEYEHLLQSERYKEAQMIGLTSFEKGVEKGQRALVERQLRRKFGPLSPAVQQRLAALPGDRLAELGEALMTTASLRELGLEGDEGSPPP